ncbi:MAG: type I restriction endonuclease subunit R [Polyangiaceae bacterium]|nr:type I restriction endonuclease subunit R [Polyangiaceae bacterium]
MPGTKERDFEDAIERDLVASGGYASLAPEGFDRDRALFADEFLSFVRDSQPAVFEKLTKDHGARLASGLVDALAKNLDSLGPIEVLRRGFKFFGVPIRAAYFCPAIGLDAERERQYAANRLRVVRQLPPDPTSNQTVDVVLVLNGIPVVTVELKNAMTGQTVAHAKKQYQERDPRLALFRFDRGALVHFAVDTDEAWMTTQLAKSRTRFLPFNRGRDGGGGNPNVLGESYPSEYLWKEVLQRDSLLDILQRFVHSEGGKTAIFPRYHQLDAVRQLEAAARDEGPGHSYLIQHSAGSGKSNSIAWLAHRLASLHGADQEKVFHSIIVVTDRRVLDKQLQDTIYQFDHKQGVVERIDRDSKQLAAALEQGTPIVITTLQKFPFVTEHIGNLPSRRYAVIVDEAHSSQTGEAARSLKEVLGGEGIVAAEAPPDYDAGQDEGSEERTSEDEIVRVIATRGRQPNLSFFAFTATPKAKTLELFGRPGPDGRPVPFHLYTMRQAIEEGFILDVLLNYTTYKTYYRLVQQSAEDPDVNKREAAAALARFVSLHPYNIAQKVEVIVEHFRRFVMAKLQGRARAMVVTRSRLHAVRFKVELDKYLAAKGYSDMKALVAFSGDVLDPDAGPPAYTETGLNGGLSEVALPDTFAKDPYRVLIVAEKYQTGFDQPLLCAMYVDKKLAGVQAVQTLSRLNRSYPAKETFVLDFVNEAEEIVEAFQPFYEQTVVSETADPHQLDRLAHELDDAQVWHRSELEGFAKVFYRPKERLTQNEHAEIERWLRPAVDRFRDELESDEARDEWRAKLATFVRLYEFLSQVMGYPDRDLEIRASFGKLLLRKLPGRSGERFRLDGDVELDAYRLEQMDKGALTLQPGADAPVKGPTEVGSRKAEDLFAPFSDIVNSLNERFGSDLTEADRLLLDQVVEDGVADEVVRQRAQANSFDNFALSIRKVVDGLMIDRLERNDKIVGKYLDESAFGEAVFGYIAREMFRKAAAQPGDAP